MIIAVDFDGTLCEDKSPGLGEPRMEVINKLIKFKSIPENRLILWTCRTGQMLKDAIEWCNSYGLEFDEVNDNVREQRILFPDNGRKVFAHIYLDDRAQHWEDWLNDN